MKYTTAFISVFLATATALAAPSDLSTGAQLRLKDIRTQGICPNFTVKCVLGKDWRNPVGNVSLSTVTEEEEGRGRGRGWRADECRESRSERSLSAESGSDATSVT